MVGFLTKFSTLQLLLACSPRRSKQKSEKNFSVPLLDFLAGYCKQLCEPREALAFALHEFWKSKNAAVKLLVINFYVFVRRYFYGLLYQGLFFTIITK